MSSTFKPLFSTAAASYSDFSSIQQTVFHHLFSQPPALLPGAILDIGCGSGDTTACLSAWYPDYPLLGTDLSFEMIKQAQARFPDLSFAQGSADTLFCPREVTLLTSSSTLQWVDPLRPALITFQKQCQPGAWLYLSIFGPKTLDSLQKGLNAVLSCPPTLVSSRFKTQEQLHQDMTRVFGSISEPERLTLYQSFSNIKSLFQTIRKTGALEPFTGGLWTPRQVMGLERYFLDTFGEIRVEYDVFLYRFSLPV